MRARDLRRDVEARGPGPAGSAARRRARTAGTGARSPPAGSARRRWRPTARSVRRRSTRCTRTGASGAPCVSALPSRLESSCAMRARSQSTGSVESERRSRSPGPGRRRAVRRRPARSTGSERLVASRVEREAAAQAAAREIQHVVDQLGHARDAVLHQRDDASSPSRSSGVFCSSLAPASIEASGLRRSCPSTAMNCSRSSAVCALVQQARLARRQPLVGIEMKGDQLGEQLEHADRLGVVQPRRLADRSRTACRRSGRPARTIGIEM